MKLSMAILHVSFVLVYSTIAIDCSLNLDCSEKQADIADTHALLQQQVRVSVDVSAIAGSPDRSSSNEPLESMTVDKFENRAKVDNTFAQLHEGSAVKVSPEAQVCAMNERDNCACDGTVYFGKKFKSGQPGSGETTTLDELMASDYKVQTVTGSVECSSSAMGGDPAPGFYKYCYCGPKADTDNSVPINAHKSGKPGKCQEPQANHVDAGYWDLYHGWYDVQGCGKCNDYCRWVGGSGSGGDPAEKLVHQHSWWSCRLAGYEWTHSPQGFFSSWNFGKCIEEGGAPPIRALRSELPKLTIADCKEANPNHADAGYYDHYFGWYDVQGCGKCNDYCRWVGGSGSGGDPSLKRFHKSDPHAWPSWWSCRLAGETDTHSPVGYFTDWDLGKCLEHGATPPPIVALKSELPTLETCEGANPNHVDAGWYDGYRGWYDLQGCGRCNDYCRWVGGAGSGGDPSEKLVHQNGWWSCRLAGHQNTHSPQGYFSAWDLPKCAGLGGVVPPVRAIQSELPKLDTCKNANPNHADPGYYDQYHGWYDVQGCGKCNDYCRWVGGSGSGGNPSEKLVYKNGEHWQSWWSCRLAGLPETYTPEGYFSEWDLTKCLDEGAAIPPIMAIRSELPKPATCKDANPHHVDAGFDDDFRGWYDVQGCGKCNDYCRWVGGSGYGGDPSIRLVFTTPHNPDAAPSYWSCRLAGVANTHSPQGYFSAWNLRKCESEGAAPPVEPDRGTCKKVMTDFTDSGHVDEFQGWYDVQGCGYCNDFCRWVGDSGSGGDPQEKLSHEQSWWSCRLAGGTESRTPQGHFDSFRYPRCEREGDVARPATLSPEPYVPGNAGKAWSVEEMLIVRAKLHRMFMEGGRLTQELNLVQPEEAWASYPDAAKVLRLGFHDCLKYTDGSGGCDGCLQWDGVETRYSRDMLGTGLINASSKAVGHNNGLSPTVHVLEAIYRIRSFPKRTPMLDLSLQQSGKSRADLWAFAVIEAVRFTMNLNSKACEDPEGSDMKGFNNCHPRWNTSDNSCTVTMPTFSFKTGRKDCDATTDANNNTSSFKTFKEESHPNAWWNGEKVVEFFQRDFNFSGREAVAILGAHTLGRFHVTISLLRYTWKTRSGMLFNNGYFRNMVKKPDWLYSSELHLKPCSISTTGNSSGDRPEARWLTVGWGDTDVGGPIQWIQEKWVCPRCEVIAEDPTRTAEYDRCCVGVPRGACKPGCENWEFVVGIDETMASSDIGMYLQFDVDSHGVPSGCPGFENFNKTHPRWSEINGQKAEPGCPLQTLSSPPGSTPLYQVVEEYANDMAKFIDDFVPAMQKMLSNGYSDGELTEAPSNGMNAFSCANVPHQYSNEQYHCTSDQ